MLPKLSGGVENSLVTQDHQYSIGIHFGNALNATELYTLKWLILYYVNLPQNEKIKSPSMSVLL